MRMSRSEVRVSRENAAPHHRCRTTSQLPKCAAVQGLRETAQDAEGQTLRIVHGAGRGMRCLITLAAPWTKAIQSFRLRLHDGIRQSGRRCAAI